MVRESAPSFSWSTFVFLGGGGLGEPCLHIFILVGRAGSLLLGGNVAHVNPLDIVATLGMDLNTHQVVSRVGAVALAH